MLGFAGIDLTCSPSKRSAYALLGDGLNIHRLELFGNINEIIAAIENDSPKVTGIDSPLCKPKDLHCFKDDCSCPDPLPKGRKCERDLRKQGIPSYYTTKKSIIKKMILRAIVLKKELCARRFNVIEVYPYATKRRLWGKEIPKKTTTEGRRFLQDRLSTIIANIGEYEGKLNHDQYDAIIAAYTAYLYSKRLTEPIGDRVEGYIHVPL